MLLIQFLAFSWYRAVHFRNKQHDNISDYVERLSGSLNDHFAFNVNAYGIIVEDGDKINYLHCDKQFTYCGSKFFAEMK